jgi:hypothetical protein
MTTTANMLLTLPTPGGDIGTWDDELNASISLIDTHDHSTGKGVAIGVSGINLNADLPYNGNSATDLKSVDFTEVASVSSGARRFFWSSSDHEFYIRNAAGVNIKVTSGSGLNLSLVGGIVGDYSSIGAEVAYDDANDRYTFKQQTSGGVKQWARLSSADVDLYEYKAAGDVTNITNRVRLSSPAALAGNYVLKFPPALPASTKLLQSDSAGALTFTDTPTLAGVTLSGTAVTKHGSYVRACSLVSGQQVGGTTAQVAADGVVTAGGAGAVWMMPVDFDVGVRLQSVKFYYQRAGGTLTFDIREYDPVGGAVSTIGTTNIASGTTLTNISIAALNYTTLANRTYHLRWTAGANLDTLNAVSITYDQP